MGVLLHLKVFSSYKKDIRIEERKKNYWGRILNKINKFNGRAMRFEKKNYTYILLHKNAFTHTHTILTCGVYTIRTYILHTHQYQQRNK